MQINNSLLQLSDLADILPTVLRIYVKLALLRDDSPAAMVAYAAHPSAQVTHVKSPAVVRIAMNAPVTLVLGVSESLGKALASLLDAVGHVRLHYEKVKLEVQREKVAMARSDAARELQHALDELALLQQADETRMAMQERALDFQARPGAQKAGTRSRGCRNDGHAGHATAHH